MFSFLSLTNNSVTIGLSYMTKHISNHIIKFDQYFSVLLGLHSSIFHKYPPYKLSIQ